MYSLLKIESGTVESQYNEFKDKLATFLGFTKKKKKKP